MTDTAALEAHKAGLRRMLNTQKHADLVLRCTEDGKEFKVHKVVVCTQSKFFEKACEPNSFKEGKENHIDLTIGNSSIISILLNYLYTLDYAYNNEDILVSHVKVYEAASFYDIPILQTMVVREFEKHLLGECDSLPKAIEAIYNDIPSFDRKLRDLALDAIVKNSGPLLGTSEEGATELSKMMDDLPQLGKDLTYCFLFENAKIKTAYHTAPSNSTKHPQKIVHRCATCFTLDAWRFPGGRMMCDNCESVS
ncbi:hypothetical protein E2P81_ATG06739 [Venturia nashicola]|uniref:BTB domain-containing protein n=1 Tax=Venturia nashicola TaxID=86259 RepID=A0A4Z1NWT6_9PEZI|nr:hypothetical protein E6O75_ATG06910 [Venturia nashicola]TLD30086.1 hypothetical protein E2P81_ATG06739 [Venturia nashicola]